MRDSAIVVALSLFVGLAGAAESSTLWVDRSPTNLPPQALGSALKALALQRKFQIVFASSEVAMLRTQGAVGHLTVGEALDRILSGTGLTFTHLNDGTVMIAGSVNAHESAATRAGSAPSTSNDGTEAGNPAQATGRDRPSTQDPGPAGLKSVNKKPQSTSMENKMPRKPILVRLASVLAAAFAASVSAQSPAAAQTEELQEVTITGSRIITNGNDSPTPVTVVNLQQLETANPGPIGQAMAQLPALLATPNQGGQGTGANGGFNLRGIGGGRTLQLYDGHRVANTDTNLLPTMLLRRVDIVTGGVSAVYGSDAVSGVVNFITDNNFNGVKVSGQTGVTAFNDDRTYNLGIAYGTSLFNGRGHIEFSYQNFNDPGIASRYRRDWGRGLWSTPGVVAGSTASPGSAANPFGIVSNTRMNTSTWGGLITSGPLAGTQFAQNGLLTPFVHGVATGTSTIEIGGDGAYMTNTSAFAGQNINQGFGRFDFSVTDEVKAYAELAVGTSLNWSNGANTTINRTFGYNNAFLATIQPAYQSQLASVLRGSALGSINAPGTFALSRMMNQNDAWPASRSETRGVQYLFMSGLDFSWGKYKWNIGYERANAVSTAFNPTNYSTPRLFAALNAVVNPANGQIVCAAALTNPSAYGSCVPMNLFGPSATNRDAFNYISTPSRNATTILMDDVTASVTGAPFNTWAGEVGMAVSAEWRHQSFRTTTTAASNDPVSCVGIQFNCTATTAPYQSSTAPFTKRSTTAKELAYEVQVPLLKDAIIARNVTVDGAVRYTNYETSGTVWSWKLGLKWALSDAVALRGGRSRDIRAPSLTQLYTPQTSTSMGNYFDPHTGITGSTQRLDGGNPDLVPELADTTTLGIVWTPHFIEGLSASLDYYRIKVNKGFNSPNPTQPATQALCENSNGTSPVCALFVRPLPFSDTSAANFPTAILNFTVNTGGLLAYGADGEIDYSRLIDGHKLEVRALVNYQPHLLYDQSPAPIVDVGGAADGVPGLAATPSVKGLLQLNYDVTREFVASVQTRYRNALRQNGQTIFFFAVGKQPPTWYTDLNLNYKARLNSGDMNLFFNVKNVFNKQPDPWASTGGTTSIGSFGGWLQGDDPLGRYYTVGFRYKL